MIPAMRDLNPGQGERLLHSARLALFSVLCGVSVCAETAAQEPNVSGTEQSSQTDRAVTFTRMPADQVQSSLLEWLASASADNTVIEQESKKWQDTSALAALTGEELLDLLVESFAAADSASKRLLEQSYGSGPLDEVIFDGVRNTPFYRNHIQLFRARWMTQHRYYDDALPILNELRPDDVVDPAGLLFYRAVSQSELLQRRDALDSLALLLHNTLDVPARFRVVAELLQKNLVARQDEGMDQVALLMKDVERRLDLGKSGEKTQGQEDAVIAALDKMLEEMDQQNQQQNGGGGGGSAQNQSGTQGAQDSMIKGSPAAGEADRKELKEGGKWGMMDKKAEARARELIRQKFPPNFLDQIGRYTRKIAEQNN